MKQSICKRMNFGNMSCQDGEMAQQAKTLDNLGSIPSIHGGEVTHESCPLTFTHMPWHLCPCSHTSFFKFLCVCEREEGRILLASASTCSFQGQQFGTNRDDSADKNTAVLGCKFGSQQHLLAHNIQLPIPGQTTSFSGFHDYL